MGVLAVSLAAVRFTLGAGEPYPDVGTTPRVASGDVQVLAQLEFPPGNVASSPSGRIFFDLHPFTVPQRFTDAFVFELVDGEPVPYPDLESQSKFEGVLGMTVDGQERLWLIAPAGLESRPTRLFGYDTRTGELVMEHEFDASVGLFLQDLRVSPDAKTIYLADTGAFFLADPALVVFDIESKRAHRVLEGHPSIEPQPWKMQTIDGPYELAYGLVNFEVGVDGLAVSHDGRWLYYATMSHDSVFRIETAVLRDDTLTDAERAEHVERVGPKPLSDGIEVDDRGNLYLTDVEHGGVMRLRPDGTLETLTRDPSVVWADGVTLLPEGRVVFTDSEIPAYIDPLLRPPLERRIHRAAPHRIFAFEPPRP